MPPKAVLEEPEMVVVVWNWFLLLIQRGRENVHHVRATRSALSGLYAGQGDVGVLVVLAALARPSDEEMRDATLDVVKSLRGRGRFFGAAILGT